MINSVLQLVASGRRVGTAHPMGEVKMGCAGPKTSNKLPTRPKVGLGAASDGPNAKRLFDLWDCLQEVGQCLRLPNARFEGEPSAQCLPKELPDLLKEELRRCVNGS